MAKTVADEGWSVVGVLDGPVSRRLLRAVDEVAARFPDAGTAGQLHQLSGLAQHPDLAAVVDWPPLLALVVELLSPTSTSTTPTWTSTRRTRPPVPTAGIVTTA
jgi:hypothetical protein